jgi:co-chaperonin GroES (HSP10)
MTFTLLRDRIVVRPIEESETRARGMLIPDAANSTPRPNEVFAAGNGGTKAEHVRIAGEIRSGDDDVRTSAIEDERQSATTNSPGLDDNTLPNDAIAITRGALGPREDRAQG